MRVQGLFLVLCSQIWFELCFTELGALGERVLIKRFMRCIVLAWPKAKGAKRMVNELQSPCT